MISCESSNQNGRLDEALYTVVSTFEKKNSLVFNLIFGQPQITRRGKAVDQAWTNAFEYWFLPGQIFGIVCESKGVDYQKFHYVLVLRACSAGQLGTLVPGINPGAEVLVQALTNSISSRLNKVLDKISQNGLNFMQVEAERYRILNDLLQQKMSPKYFIGELLAQQKLR